MIVVSVFESPAVVAGLDNVAVMGQPLEERGGHLGVAEHARPFAEGEVGGHDDGGTLLRPADEVEEKLSTGLDEGKITEVVQDDELHPGQMLGEASLSSVASLGLEAIDEIDDVVEAAAGTSPDATSGDGNGQMGFTARPDPLSVFGQTEKTSVRAFEHILSALPLTADILLDRKRAPKEP
ncbi:hypothetical protein ACVWYH_006548 [Bradyrhizobium sp. GM24.11]